MLIQMMQNINMLLNNIKILVLKSMKIQGLLLNIQIICKMSIKILRSTALVENVKY